ncbi:hypothetical protein FRB99_005567 [Tulasnella sp. 403]|nr:hypothetical protein FRB99_005567 [Tulasnella sp. 403]
MSLLHIESDTFDPRPAFPLRMSAKHYTSAKTVGKRRASPYTLVMLHGAGFLKESWEPVLEHLFEITSHPDSRIVIEEAWALDCQNHGESAVLNAEVLARSAYNDAFETADWADATYQFLESRLGLSSRAPHERPRLIGVGHSMGAVTLLHLAQTHPKFFTSAILLDPILFPLEFDRVWSGVTKHLVASAYQRRDVWPSQKAALKDLAANPMFKTWDPRQIALFVEHGLCEHPGNRYLVPYGGVTLKCTRDMEAALYRGGVELRSSVLKRLPFITNAIPIFVAFGDVNDSVPRKVQDTLVDRSKGTNFAKVTRIPDAGHLVVQQQPFACAQTIFESLQSLNLDRRLESFPGDVVMPAPGVRRAPPQIIKPGENVFQMSAKL